MCTETFLRLPEEKRGRFLEAAWEEFTTVPFTRASVNQIVRRARIPRGSFYQYFSDKADLFSYLMESTRAQMLETFRGILIRSGGDLFRAAESAFASFLEQRQKGTVPLLDQCVSVARINPGMEMEAVFAGRPKEFLSGDVLKEADTSALRRQDADFVRQVSAMIGMCLGGANMDSICRPERMEDCRGELAQRLDIIRQGSLRREALKEGGEEL